MAGLWVRIPYTALKPPKLYQDEHDALNVGNWVRFLVGVLVGRADIKQPAASLRGATVAQGTFNP